MKKMFIREVGDQVFFLDETSFKRGYVNKVSLFQDCSKREGTIKINSMGLSYKVKTDYESDLFDGLQRSHNEVFDSLQEMIDYYSAAKI